MCKIVYKQTIWLIPQNHYPLYALSGNLPSVSLIADIDLDVSYCHLHLLLFTVFLESQTHLSDFDWYVISIENGA